MTASTPCASSQRASSTVVAEEKILAPSARTRASSSFAGRPKWKLTTAGRNSASTSAASALNARHGRGVAEEIDVERPARRRLDRGELGAHRFEAEHRARQRAEAAGVA